MSKVAKVSFNASMADVSLRQVCKLGNPTLAVRLMTLAFRSDDLASNEIRLGKDIFPNKVDEILTRG
jgi:hypothetical protein